MNEKLASLEETAFSLFDYVLIAASAVSLAASFFFRSAWPSIALEILSFAGLIPVAYSAFRSLIEKSLSVDLLAAIALGFSLLAHEWSSAAFITLMLAFARVFDRLTEARAQKAISSLMKYHVELVRIKSGETITEVHVSQVRVGDHVIVDTGDRMPVDGMVISGTADVDESSLTGESELVPKKAGDNVYTATVNESGSLIVRAERIGKDATLSKIMALIDEASRSKNKAERAADKFTQIYILAALATAIAMYLFGLSTHVILAVLLVVCADDIAVAVPLAFTAAITRAARRGVIVKGSAAFEQLSHMKYILADKTGTLTRGKPKVVDIRAYGSMSPDAVLERCGMAASESRHIVSRAILEYIADKKLRIHAADEFNEVPGQGIVFSHGGEHMLFGRLSFMEQKGVPVHEELRKAVIAEKDMGRGVAVLAVDGSVAGLVAYQDELRPRAMEIVAETRALGVREWHMLTGDNERAAKAVADQIGIKHFHANMTPETKVEFVRHFEKERKKGDIVGYIGDGVNDAASLSLVDVSIAMGGIGSDAAIAAADITIMKDNLARVPEIIGISHKVINVMRWNFAIWAITNSIGLGLVAFGVIGPAGAATYNFLTDFIPIANALRAGRGSKKNRIPNAPK